MHRRVMLWMKRAIGLLTLIYFGFELGYTWIPPHLP